MDLIEVLVDPEWPRRVRLGLLQEAARLAARLDCSFHPPKESTDGAVGEVVFRLRNCVVAAAKMPDSIRQHLIDSKRWPPVPEGEPPLNMIRTIPVQRSEETMRASAIGRSSS